MNAKQRFKNRQTAEALHYAIQATSSRNHHRTKRYPVTKQERREQGSRQQGGYTLLELLVVIAFLCAVAIVAVAGYVAWHFLAKFW